MWTVSQLTRLTTLMPSTWKRLSAFSIGHGREDLGVVGWCECVRMCACGCVSEWSAGECACECVKLWSFLIQSSKIEISQYNETFLLPKRHISQPPPHSGTLILPHSANCSNHMMESWQINRILKLSVWSSNTSIFHTNVKMTPQFQNCKQMLLLSVTAK